MATAPNRLRKQLLRDAVDENLDTMSGQPMGSTRRRRTLQTARLRRSLLAAVIVSLVGVTVAAWMWTGDAGGGHPAAETVGPGVIESASPNERDRQPEVHEIVERLSVSSPQPLLPELIPLRVGRIALDPGHGGVDGGTSMGYGLLEKDLTKDISNRLGRLLEQASCEVVSTRRGDQAVSLKRRAEIANDARADLFLSIHVNWLPDRTARGVEIYYLGPTDDPFLRRLAAAENRDSGFALADYRDLLQGIYADVRQDQSQRLARTIQESLYGVLHEENPDIVSRGVMSAPFAVLVATEMPAVLVEVACLSNDREARLLALPRYRQRIAEALFAGVTRYAMTIESSTIEKGS